MIAEAIDRILLLGQPPTFKDGEDIERHSSSGIILSAPNWPQSKGSSLDSAVVVAVDAAKAEEYQTVVECSRKSVQVSVYDYYNGHKVRHVIHVATPVLPEGFPFGRPLDIENFKIEASDFFERDENFRQLIAAVSSIVDVQETIVDDDGISQTVTYKNGIGRKDSGKIEPYVTLRAFRTFREVEQPQATYLLRIGKGRDGPTVTLHEASGYLWKVQCDDAVYQYIKNGVGDFATVIR